MAEKQLKVGDRVKYGITSATLVELRGTYAIIEYRQGNKLKRLPILLSELQVVC